MDETRGDGPTPKLKKVFLVHGEPEQSLALAEAIRTRYKVEATPVEPGQVCNFNPTTGRSGKRNQTWRLSIYVDSARVRSR